MKKTVNVRIITTLGLIGMGILAGLIYIIGHTFTYEGKMIDVQSFVNHAVVEINNKEKTFNYVNGLRLEFCDEKENCIEVLDIEDVSRIGYLFLSPLEISKKYSVDMYIEASNKTIIKKKLFQEEVVNIKVLYEKEKLEKIQENQIREEFIYFDIARKEYDSKKEPPFELEVKLNVPKKNKDKMFIVFDEDRYKKKVDIKNQKESTVRNYFHIYNKIENERFKRKWDGLIVDKEYLKNKIIILPEKLTIFKFENEEELQHYDWLFKNFFEKSSELKQLR